MTTTPIRSAWVLSASVLSFTIGYAVSSFLNARVEPPTRSVNGAVVPPGIASDLHAALSAPDLFDRTSRVAALLAPLGPDALDAVRASFDSVLLDSGDMELVLFSEWWARFDPEAAFAWARANRIGWHPAVLTALMRTWARQDPEAARAAAATVGDERLRQASLIGVVRGWEESGQGGLQEFLAASPAESSEFTVAIETLVRGIALREGAEAAMAWADSIPASQPGQTDGFRTRVRTRVATALAAIDPKLAGTWAARHRRDPDGHLVLFRVGVSWARSDGAAAMDWLASLPREPELTNLAVQETYRIWFGQDREAATAWIEQQAPAPWLDPALETYAKVSGGTQPEHGLRWAERIQDERRRQSATIRIAATWLLEDPDAARAWLDQTDLDDSTRASIVRLAEDFASRRERRERLAQQRAASAAAAAASELQ
jgi:hypothetical protein